MDATLDAESGQATLDGMPEAVQAPAPLSAEACDFGAIGRLLAPAHVHTTRHHEVQLAVLIEQRIEHHPQALPLLAVLPWPDAGSYAATHDEAQRAAALMPAGEIVGAFGTGCETGIYQGKPVLRLIRCRSIQRAAQWSGAASTGDRH